MKITISKKRKSALRPDTLCIHGGINEDAKTGSINFPIYQASTFRYASFGKHNGYEYGRTGNPTRHSLEMLIADLEKGEAGFAFSSGMAALSTVLLMFEAGGKILISQDIYGGTYRIFESVFKNFNLEYEMVNTTSLKDIKDKFAQSKNIKAILIETPSNPLLSITDIAGVAEIAKNNNALTIVDNTFMSPYLQNPLELGADIAVHSATKYLGGHSDVVAGLIACKDMALAEKIGFLQNSLGTVLGPFDSWILMKGIKTLAIRMDKHLENAEYIAKYLSNHKGVDEFYYPGMPNFDGYELNKKQARGAGAMMSFKLSKNYDIAKFFNTLDIIALAESLGGVESLICHPATMTHAAMPKEIQQLAGITDNLIRLSVGIENKDDLKDDLEFAFQAAT
jgi:cystathionine beta-lyase